jgi:hypothetical protein
MAVQEVLELWVRAQIVDSKIATHEVREVGRSFLIRLLQEFERFVLVSQAG